MHVELIKATLRINGTSCAAIAKKLKVTPNAVSMVIHGKSASRRIRRAVARAMKKPIDEVFPMQRS